MTYFYDAAELRDLSTEAARDYNDEMRAVPARGGCYEHDHRPDGRGGLTCRSCGDTIGSDEL